MQLSSEQLEPLSFCFPRLPGVCTIQASAVLFSHNRSSPFPDSAGYNTGVLIALLSSVSRASGSAL